MKTFYFLLINLVLLEGCEAQVASIDSSFSDTSKSNLILMRPASKPLEDDWSSATAVAESTEPLSIEDLPISNWFNINTFDSTIAFSKIARLGKISVFVVSTAWCAPCKTLKAALKQQTQFASKVDFYDINMCYQRKYSELEKVDAYAYARIYDRLKEWPRVVITSQTGSIIKSFSAVDLEEERIKKRLYDLYMNAAKAHHSTIDMAEMTHANTQPTQVFDKTIEIIERLLKDEQYFNVKKVVSTVSNSSIAVKKK